MKSNLFLALCLLFLALMACKSRENTEPEFTEYCFQPTWFEITTACAYNRWVVRAGTMYADTEHGPKYLYIRLIGKTAKYSSRDSIAVNNEQMKVTKPISKDFLPLGEEYQTVVHKVTGNVEVTFRSAYDPPISEQQLRDRLERARILDEWVKFKVEGRNSLSVAIQFLKK
jgi:hypothetical protein